MSLDFLKDENGVSYAEKFMNSNLDELDEDFFRQLFVSIEQNIA
tara:strand:+ start:114 stop:245 length:132 start_codon:yes stop_codon:yes gene_type:complete